MFSPGPGGRPETRTVQVIDWRRPEANDFLLASQLWVRGDMHRRRPDLVGFVNGIPLLLVELKKFSAPLRSAYDDNLTDYRDTIPHLFTPNALIILSNGADTRVGSTFAGWQFFNEWSYRAELEASLATAKPEERPVIEAQIALMASTDMAVVVSQSQNEIKELDAKGLNIRPHRKRLVDEDLDERFKNADDPLRLVFVCAMWITGFDVPSCSTNLEGVVRDAFERLVNELGGPLSSAQSASLR